MRVWPYCNSVFQGNAVEFLFYVYGNLPIPSTCLHFSHLQKNSSLVTMVTVSELKKLNISFSCYHCYQLKLSVNCLNKPPTALWLLISLSETINEPHCSLERQTLMSQEYVVKSSLLQYR